jgi:cell division GTPase FtsZ
MAAGSKYIAAEGSGSPCRIKVVGVGGGGGNAVNRFVVILH